MSELKPCPFCGGEAETRENIQGTTLDFVRCSKCKITTAFYEDIKEAIKTWNQRHDR